MRTTLQILGAMLAWQCATSQAQLVITTNTIPPAIGAYDQFYLPGPVDEATGAMTPSGSDNTTSGANDGLTYVALDQVSKGQSFTTGPNPSGYTISAVTVRHILWTNFLANGTYMSIPSGNLFDFRFGTISGTTLTTILTTNAVYSGSPLSMAGGSGTGIYFTFDLSGPAIGTLAPNTTYFFELAAPAGYFELHNTRNSANSYTGGTAFVGDTIGQLDQSSVVTLSAGEFAFDVALAAVGAPSVVAVANPASGSFGQTFTVMATVTAGAGTVTNVSVNLSAIGGSAAASLVLSNANVYTNTFTVPAGASFGAANLTVTATDSTPLTGTCGVLYTVLPSSRVWNGGSLIDSKWSTSTNWQGNFAPTPTGNSVIFAGTTRLTPDVDVNYNITGMTFSNTAGGFTIGSSTGSTLTIGSGGIADNSASAQTLNLPVVMGSGQTISMAGGGLTLNSNLTGGFDLTTAGAGVLTLAGSGTNSLGNLRLVSGQLNIAAGTVNVSDAAGSLTRVESNATLVVSGGTLNITGGAALNGWFPIGVTAGQTATVTVAGGTINVTDHWGTEIGNESGAGILNINSGTFLNNDAGNVGFLIGESGSMGGTVNLNGGKLIVNQIVAHAGGNFYFNGGTLTPLASTTGFWSPAGTLAASVRNGGAVVDTTGFNVTIGQPLAHSGLIGDNPTDGGLTKTGNGTLILSGGYSYTGPNKVLGGLLSMNSSLGIPGTGGDLVVSDATLVLDASSGSVVPAANVTLNTGAILQFTDDPSANAVSGTGNLSVATNTVLSVNYGVLGSGNPSMAAINVTGSISVTGTNNIINITGTGFAVGQFALIKYNSGGLASVGGFKLGILPAGVNAVLVNNTVNQSIDLNITFIGQSLTWYGTNALWNINTTYNWNTAAAKYLEYGTSPNIFGDLVTFDDTLYNDGIHPPSTNVTLTTTLQPSQITVNSSLPYSFTGAGSIAGTASLIMNGTGSLTLGTLNSYSGGTFVNAGTLVVTNDSALGASSGGLTMGGGTLQIAGNTVSTRPVILTANSTIDTLTNVTAQIQLNGSGVGGLTKTDDGLLVLSSAGTSAIGNLLVNGGQLNVTAGTISVTDSSGALTKVDNGATVMVSGGALDIGGSGGWFPIGDTANTTSTMIVSGGTVNVTDNYGTEVGRTGSGVLTINSGGYLNNDTANIGFIIGDFGAAAGTVNLNGGTLTVNHLVSNAGTDNFYFNGGTLSPIASSTTFWSSFATLTAWVRNGGAIVDTAGNNITIAQPLLHSTVSGDNAVDGGLTKVGDGTLSLSAVNSYTGPTVINAGALAGTGTVAGALTNNATLAPGSGALTINGNITLKAGSTNTFAVNGTTLAKGSVAAGASVIYGGTLNIVPGGTFATGQQFQLFSGIGATNTGNFARIVGSPGSGLGFSFTNGILSVIAAGPAGSEHLTNNYSAGVLSLSWPAGEGWRLQGQTNNLSTGLGTNWVYLTDGSLSSTNITVDSAKPATFYRLAYP